MLNKSLKHRHFVAGQFLSRAFVVLLRKSIPQNHNLKTAAELGVSEYTEMSLNRNFKAVIFSVFAAILLSGCCGPCFAPCNPFHKDKAPVKEQPLSEKVQK